MSKILLKDICFGNHLLLLLQKKQNVCHLYSRFPLPPQYIDIQYFVTNLDFFFSCRHCECLPPKFPENCQGQKGATCTNNKQCGQYGSCGRKDQNGAGTGQVVNNGQNLAIVVYEQGCMFVKLVHTLQKIMPEKCGQRHLDIMHIRYINVFHL